MKTQIYRILKKILYIITKQFPFRKKTVLFCSFEGQYNDNPKYISEKLHELAPNIDIVWIISDKCREYIPAYIKCISDKGKEYINYTYRSHVIVDNIIGFRWIKGIRNSKLKRGLLSSNRQLNISTWHGTPIKKIGRDSRQFSNIEYFISSSDYLIAGCEYTKEKLSQAFNPIPVKLCGTPRNDILVNGLTSIQSEEIKKRLGIPADKKAVLFAPTFRDSVEYSGIIQLEQFDIKRILTALSNKFDGEWVFIFRVHHSVLKKINTEKLTSEHPNRLINGNLFDDMAEYLSVADALITDYSGSVFDFALTGRPGFLFTPDKENYINSERGVYIPLDRLPYPYATDLEQFYQLIEHFDEMSAKLRIDHFLHSIGNAENGHAAEIIAKEIIEFLNNMRKNI